MRAVIDHSVNHGSLRSLVALVGGQKDQRIRLPQIRIPSTRLELIPGYVIEDAAVCADLVTGHTHPLHHLEWATNRDTESTPTKLLRREAERVTVEVVVEVKLMVRMK